MGLELEKQEDLRGKLNDFMQNPRDAVFTPDYDFQRFFFVVPKMDAPRQEVIFHEQLSVAEEILKADPDTKIDIFVTDQNDLAKATKMLGDLQKMIGTGRLRIRVGKYTEELWARDFGVPTKVRNFGATKNEFVMGQPFTRKKEGKSEIVKRSEAHSEKDTGIKVTRVPVVIQGGNIAKTELNGRKILIVGSSDIRRTQRAYRDGSSSISEREAVDVYKKAFGADEVIILGPNVPQSKYAFHIDQAVFFPKEGTAVLLKPSDPDSATEKGERVVEMLSKYKKQLQDEGFSVIEIPTTMAHIENYESYANVVPLEHNGNTTVVMPSFGDRKTEEEITRKLMGAGMDVIFVPNSTGDLEGNIHCFTGALALNRMKPSRTGIA